MVWINSVASNVSATTRSQHTIVDALQIPAMINKQNNNNDRWIIDPYTLLQIRRDATKAEIRRAYKRLALLHHPDRSNNRKKEEDKNMFAYLSASFEVLMNKSSRERYNALDDQRRYHQQQNDGSSSKASSSSGSRRMHRVLTCGGGGWSTDGLHKNHHYNHGSSCTSFGRFSSAQGSTGSCASFSPRGRARKRNPPARNPLHLWLSNSIDCDEPDEDYVLLYQASTSTSSSSSDDYYDDDTVVTREETERLFGGPMTMLHRANNHRPFSNPQVVFRDVFDGNVFSSQQEAKSPYYNSSSNNNNNRNRDGSNSPPSPPSPGWQGSSITHDDGTRISRLTRTVRGKRMVQIKTIRVDPDTGQVHQSIQVTSEELSDDGSTISSKKKEHDDPNCCCCGTCEDEEEQRQDDSIVPCSVICIPPIPCTLMREKSPPSKTEYFHPLSRFMCGAFLP